MTVKRVLDAGHQPVLVAQPAPRSQQRSFIPASSAASGFRRLAYGRATSVGSAHCPAVTTFAVACCRAVPTRKAYAPCAASRSWMSPATNSPQPDATELWRLREIEAAKLCDASTGGCDRLLRQLSWLEAHYCQAIKTCCGAALHVPHVRLSARFIPEAVLQVAMSCIRLLYVPFTGFAAAVSRMRRSQNRPLLSNMLCLWS